MTTPALGPPRFLLPPRPKLLDWLWAGASAGLLLGLAELAVAAVRGSALEPRLAALVLGIDAALIALASLFIGAVLRVVSVRLSRSGLVGAVVGPLLLAAIAGGFAREWPAHGLERAIALSGLMTAGLLAVAAGLVASRVADALERCGVVCSAVYVWGGVALALAASERLADAGWPAGTTGVLWMTAAAATIAIVAWLGVEIAKRRGSRPARTFGSLLAWLLILSAGAAAAPTLLPWILYDRDVTEFRADATGPPNFLVVVMPDAEVSESKPLVPRSHTASSAGDAALAAPTLVRLAREGSSYAIRLGERGSVTSALLVDSRGDAIVRQFSDAGYATAAILPSEAVPAELLDVELDARAGTRRLLAGPLAWLAAAPWLTGPAQPLLGALALDTETRTADSLAQRVKAWLLNWRSQRAGTPFFLCVDFRAAAAPAEDESLLERSDALLDGLLEHLRTLDVSHATLVVALSESHSSRDPADRIANAVIRAPEGWPRDALEASRVREAGGSPPIAPPSRASGEQAGALADFLLAASHVEVTTHLGLPEAIGTP